jgi:Na+/H+-translocating membrane pyrophosphatase
MLHLRGASTNVARLTTRERFVSKKSDNWTGKAAMAGAAIGSAALAAALLYASRRKEREEKAAPKAPPVDVPETD